MIFSNKKRQLCGTNKNKMSLGHHNHNEDIFKILLNSLYLLSWFLFVWAFQLTAEFIQKKTLLKNGKVVEDQLLTESGIFEEYGAALERHKKVETTKPSTHHSQTQRKKIYFGRIFSRRKTAFRPKFYRMRSIGQHNRQQVAKRKGLRALTLKFSPKRFKKFKSRERERKRNQQQNRVTISLFGPKLCNGGDRGDKYQDFSSPFPTKF